MGPMVIASGSTASSASCSLPRAASSPSCGGNLGTTALFRSLLAGIPPSCLITAPRQKLREMSQERSRVAITADGDNHPT